MNNRRQGFDSRAAWVQTAEQKRRRPSSGSPHNCSEQTLRQLDIDRLVLAPGAHERPENDPNLDGGMCVVDAVAYIAGEPWSDRRCRMNPAEGSNLVQEVCG